METFMKVLLYSLLKIFANLQFILFITLLIEVWSDCDKAKSEPVIDKRFPMKRLFRHMPIELSLSRNSEKIWVFRRFQAR